MLSTSNTPCSHTQVLYKSPHSLTISFIIPQNRKLHVQIQRVRYGQQNEKERHLSSIIIKPATQIGTVNPKICYTKSLFIPPMEVSMLRSLCNRIKPDFCTTPTMVCDQILCAPRKCFREGLIYTAGHRFRSPSAQRP
jgi:hypothetical protein